MIPFFDVTKGVIYSLMVPIDLFFFPIGEKEEYMIRVAMTEWEKYTCVRFRPATRSDRNLVRFQNGQG